ncbi:MAG TPA: UPF0179 family protein [Methanocorpusculum sp.]|nr:UPF0179 family protein [Methanocorpusculum sp.]HJJ51471.1 UPF0179 family protein [Methanocorpusculum sp.]HKL97144.1 UPF0179 family protein [Methanocorpusculum sp.]
MDNEETIVTIVGSVYAHEGAEFVYAGKAVECESCKVAKVCHNAKLKEGKRYRVVSVRKTKHNCAVHEGGAKAVEVSETIITAVIPTSQATRRTRITYTPVCSDVYCKGYAFCHPDGLADKGRYVVLEVLGPYTECPKGIKNLKLVEMRSVPT